MAKSDLIDRDTLFEKVTYLYRCSTGDAHLAYRNVLDLILDEPTVVVQDELGEVAPVWHQRKH